MGFLNKNRTCIIKTIRSALILCSLRRLSVRYFRNVPSRIQYHRREEVEENRMELIYQNLIDQSTIMLISRNAKTINVHNNIEDFRKDNIMIWVYQQLSLHTACHKGQLIKLFRENQRVIHFSGMKIQIALFIHSLTKIMSICNSNSNTSPNKHYTFYNKHNNKNNPIYNNNNPININNNLININNNLIYNNNNLIYNSNNLIYNNNNKVK